MTSADAAQEEYTPAVAQIPAQAAMRTKVVIHAATHLFIRNALSGRPVHDAERWPSAAGQLRREAALLNGPLDGLVRRHVFRLQLPLPLHGLKRGPALRISEKLLCGDDRFTANCLGIPRGAETDATLRPVHTN
jgi:hypothetical protein